MGLGCFVGIDELFFLREGFVIEKLRQCLLSLSPRVRWLACHVLFHCPLMSTFSSQPQLSMLLRQVHPKFIRCSMIFRVESISTQISLYKHIEVLAEAEFIMTNHPFLIPAFVKLWIQIDVSNVLSTSDEDHHQ
jgi:hypothetical protein